MSKEEVEVQRKLDDDDEPDEWSDYSRNISCRANHSFRDKRIFSTGCAGILFSSSCIHDI